MGQYFTVWKYEVCKLCAEMQHSDCDLHFQRKWTRRNDEGLALSNMATFIEECEGWDMIAIGPISELRSRAYAKGKYRPSYNELFIDPMNTGPYTRFFSSRTFR